MRRLTPIAPDMNAQAVVDTESWSAVCPTHLFPSIHLNPAQSPVPTHLVFVELLFRLGPRRLCHRFDRAARIPSLDQSSRSQYPGWCFCLGYWVGCLQSDCRRRPRRSSWLQQSFVGGEDMHRSEDDEGVWVCAYTMVWAS